jgi:aminoglycoside 3-N-acetyltransferase
VNYAALVTRSSLVADLRAAGLGAGDILLVHCSLASLGFVAGAARAVIEGLLELVTPAGTLMMPTYSGELSDPAEWRYPPVPEEWIETIRRETPAYDVRLTPTRRMGVVAELFRHFPGVQRSPHPQSSFAAGGAQAAMLVGAHPLAYRFGPQSPLGKLCALGGKVLLLGAPAQTNSLFYLSEYRVDGQRKVNKRAPMMVDGRALWVEYEDLVYPNDWFDDANAALVERGIARKLRVGAAECFVMPAREAVEAVVEWRIRHRR